MRVLIVEDEVKMASLIRGGLQADGMAADAVIKGEDALRMAGKAGGDFGRATCSHGPRRPNERAAAVESDEDATDAACVRGLDPDLVRRVGGQERDVDGPILITKLRLIEPTRESRRESHVRSMAQLTTEFAAWASRRHHGYGAGPRKRHDGDGDLARHPAGRFSHRSRFISGSCVLCEMSLDHHRPDAAVMNVLGRCAREHDRRMGRAPAAPAQGASIAAPSAAHAPATVAGRVLAGALMILGFALLSVTTAAVASLFIREDEQPAEQREEPFERDVLTELRALNVRPENLEHASHATRGAGT